MNYKKIIGEYNNLVKHLIGIYNKTLDFHTYIDRVGIVKKIVF